MSFVENPILEYTFFSVHIYYLSKNYKFKIIQIIQNMFSNNMKLINKKKIPGKYPNIWNLNNTILKSHGLKKAK